MGGEQERGAMGAGVGARGVAAGLEDGGRGRGSGRWLQVAGKGQEAACRRLGLRAVRPPGLLTSGVLRWEIQAIWGPFFSNSWMHTQHRLQGAQRWSAWGTAECTEPRLLLGTVDARDNLIRSSPQPVS